MADQERGDAVISRPIADDGDDPPRWLGELDAECCRHGETKTASRREVPPIGKRSGGNPNPVTSIQYPSSLNAVAGAGSLAAAMSTDLRKKRQMRRSFI
jgi:hypothetical protein